MNEEITKAFEKIFKQLDRLEDVINRQYEPYIHHHELTSDQTKDENKPSH